MIIKKLFVLIFLNFALFIFFKSVFIHASPVKPVQEVNNTLALNDLSGVNIPVSTASVSHNKEFGLYRSIIPFINGNFRIEYDLSAGTADFYSNDKLIISSFFSAVKLPEYISSKDYNSREVIQNENVYTVLLSDGKKPDMKQTFDLKSDFFLVSVEIEGQNISSNYMAPIVMDKKSGVDFGINSDIMALWVPFDNDRDVKYDASTINKGDTSYEAAAFYDNKSRNGLVVGSVTHDTWKTGVSYMGTNNKLDALQVYGGVSIINNRNKAMVRDVQQHGFVSGNVVSSPKIFVGYFDDWRDGMEIYADANTEIEEKTEWNGGTVFGWNSWGAVGERLDTEKALAASDFIKNSLMSQSFSNNETAYINLDSYWDNPSVNLELFIERVHKNGQKAGIYWSPFVDWVKDPNRLVEGTKYRYKDAWLKDDNGNPITYGDGPYALDATHPATLRRIDYYIEFFVSRGFNEYIKLDFLTHGALEGRHYDRSVTTGIKAFNKGMSYLHDSIKDKMGANTFISQAISPLFPYRYAHSRRVSCDKFGFLYESREMMNSAGYGWWMSGRLYAYNDPDHMSLNSTWWNSGSSISENEAKTRVTTAAISGTVFLSGDNFLNAESRMRALKYLTNPNINNIARSGKVFRPLEGNTGNDAPDTFTLDNGDNTYYIAVFNWDGTRSSTKTVDLGRAGLNPEITFKVSEQWSNSSSMEKGIMTVNLGPAEAKIFLLK